MVSKQGKVECLKSFKKITLTNLPREVEAAMEEGKYVLVIDQHGSCQTFFEYKAHIKQFHKEVISNQIGKTTRDEAIEVLRSALVYSMRTGDTFVINIDKIVPDFKNEYTCDKNFPTKKIFDWYEWRD